MTERRNPHVVNLDEIDPRTFGEGNNFGATARRLGMATGAQRIGCSWYEVAPGKRAFPYHFHCANEESVFVLEGEGTLRIGADRVPVRAGDYVTFPVGPESAHQIQNTGQGPLRYLCFSTMSTAEVIGYPDSKKIAASGAPSAEAFMRGEVWIRHIDFEGSKVKYYDGEDTG